ncbi:MAG: transcription-repair coupling factor [Deltaproteobacteria bacterium]|nr:MAG: transcription-repair coupling factor [Deltaproteobacteria bacterium]
MLQNQEKISLQTLVKQIPERQKPIECVGLTGASIAYLVSRIYQKDRLPLFIILPSAKEAERFLGDLQYFLKPSASVAHYFPPYNILPFRYLSYHNETAARRIGSLYRLLTAESPPVAVTTIQACLQKVVPRKELTNYAELIMTGEEIERDHLIEKLIAGGYVRAAVVEEPGDFCVRGGILDIFSSLYSDPLRLELFGDTVESLRFFSAASQRKIKITDEAVILPAKEAILKKDWMVEIISRVREQASNIGLPVTRVRQLVDRIKNEGVFPGVESLIPLIYPKLDTVFDYAPAETLFIQIEPEELQTAAQDFEKQAFDNYNTAVKEKRLCVEPAEQYLRWQEIQKFLIQRKPLSAKALPVLKDKPNEEKAPAQYQYTIKDNAEICTVLNNPRSNRNILAPIIDWVNSSKHSGHAVLLVCRSKKQAERLEFLFGPYGIRPRHAEGCPDIQGGKGRVYLSLGDLSTGFVWSEESLAVITDDEIFGSRGYRTSRVKEEVRTELLVFEDLKKGDFVVHNEHGIGRYEGLSKLKINGSTNDFLLIVYKDDDKLYLPVDRMSMVQKYIGVEGYTPVLDKMGGRAWSRIKARVKKSAQKIAGELLKLYAARKVQKGFSFDFADEYFRDFEAGFSYEETGDQRKAINDVLRDMEYPTPMDRLICGDVGYGKTEVALRASFVAVNNGKQVAMLVPTTVLAEQHFMTFCERFQRYPVNIACLSRFRSTAEQRKIIKDLHDGKLDIVVGTHRLLSKDVTFKDLGLLILDEEQRFGVRHKEKLKKLRQTVDVLALTATPIPRTLHMSLMGIRDISIISTPPEYRRAIITYISEFDDAVVTDAIQKELKRKGQIFFVHNNIYTIQRYAQKLKQLVPEVRLAVAHGRLSEDELEAVMIRFINKDIDMLVCTTIIESGLDIPSANTILVNRADKFGLAQMYQLRGRVGRSDEQAYAYLFIPRRSSLGKNAQKRLKVLMEYSDLGSGFQIAMSDLKIRGGGTILGASQSGHIAAVGYDMFLKLMETAIAEIKGEPLQESLEPEININISAFIPESYISDIDQRLSAYRRLAKSRTLEEIEDFKAEWIDRFGKIPDEAANLLLKVMIKIWATEAGVQRLDLKGSRLSFHFSPAHQRRPYGIVDLIVSNPDRYKLSPDHVLTTRISADNTRIISDQLKNILKQVAQNVNN